MTTEKLSLDSFTGVLNTKFRLHADADRVLDVELVEAVDELAAGRREPEPGHELFSLVFAGPRTDPLVQRIYHLEHEELGELDLFLVPIAEDEAGLRYQAVFNRLHATD